MQRSVMQFFKAGVLSALLLGLTATVSYAADAGSGNQGPKEMTIKGEVVDLMCYLDHGAKGEGHQRCARGCIESGGPVGILTKEGRVYLVIGHHKPLNDKLAPLAAKTITLKGKVVRRGGMRMIENAEIVSD